MSFQDRIARLEALLDRVRRRRVEPSGRGPASAGATSAFEPVRTGIPTPLPAEPAKATVPTPLPVAPPAPLPIPTPVVAAPPAAVERAPEITVEAVAGRGSPISDVVPAVHHTDVATLEVVESAPLDALGEEDLVEMSSDVLESVPPAGVQPVTSGDLDFEEEEEEAPASSGRHRVATMGDVLAAAEREPVALDEGREVPIKTPPPESGPQEAVLPMGLTAPLAPDVDALLAADIPPISIAGGPGPTLEQLGQTIELEEARGPSIELEAHRAPTPPPPSEELEVSLPPGDSAGRYDEDLRPPPEAREELSLHLEGAGLESGSPELASATKPTMAPLETTTMPAPGFSEARATAEPEVIERPPISGVSAIAIAPAVARKPRPVSFAELLDVSIRLGG